MMMGGKHSPHTSMSNRTKLGGGGFTFTTQLGVGSVGGGESSTNRKRAGTSIKDTRGAANLSHIVQSSRSRAGQ